MKLEFVCDQDIGYANDGDAGIDLRAAEDVTLKALERGELHSWNQRSFPRERFVFGQTAVATGLRVAIPEGHVGLMRGRSGLAFKHGIWAFEGTIDAGYRGEVKVLLMNLGVDPYTIKRGDRVAQLTIIPFARCELVKVEALDPSARGEAGFGSTGVR